MNRVVRLTLAGLSAGLLVAGTTVAGALLDKPPVTAPEPPVQLPSAQEVLETAGLAGGSTTNASVAPGDNVLTPEESFELATATVQAPNGSRTPAGTFLVGAAAASLTPAPKLYDPSAEWQTAGCTEYGTTGYGNFDHTHLLPSLEDMRGWQAASPNCIYLGGNDLGPVRPAERVDAGGVWVRSVAISNGEKTFIYSIADTVGWFARYDANLCTDCGILDVRTKLAADLGDGVDVGDVLIGSTHTHAGADTYGGWGGIPTWYRSQLRDAALASAKQAVANLTPATIAVGEADLRRFNNERRDTYFSTVDTGATWLQATALDRKGRPAGVIATLATFGAHPTMIDGPVLHADWPGATARAFERTYGGVGLLFEGALGNSSISGTGDGPEARGSNVAAAIGESIADDATPLVSNDLVAEARELRHPVTTNAGLVTLGSVGLFDREFTPGTPGAGLPSEYRWSKSGSLEGTPAPRPEEKYLNEAGRGRFCASAGPTVITTAGAHRIGDLIIAFGPGELFGTLAEVVKERADGLGTVMVLGQMNDALGYIIQSFEFDVSGNVVTEYGTRTGEYEEVFALDRCLGDHVLETMLSATGALGAGR